jgi:hypothetical protein
VDQQKLSRVTRRRRSVKWTWEIEIVTRFRKKFLFVFLLWMELIQHPLIVSP